MNHVYHLDLTEGALQGATVALLPGDPGRVERIAAHLDEPKHLASHREYTSFLGTIEGRPVVVCSTGIGGPGTSIAVEELAQLGVRTFIRTGTTGAIQPGIDVGSVIITNGSVRLDGASRDFAPITYPAVADYHCTVALVDSAASLGLAHRVGITASTDTFYPGQERYDTVSGYVPRHLQRTRDEWERLGVLNYEMESATLFTMCSANGWRAGCVSGVLVNRTQTEAPAEDQIKMVEEGAIATAVGAADRLLRGAT